MMDNNDTTDITSNGKPIIYTGKTIDTMPRLVSEGRLPISSLNLMKLRNYIFEKKADNEKLLTIICYDEYNIADGLVSNKNGDVKIYLDSPNLLTISKDSKTRVQLMFQQVPQID